MMAVHTDAIELVRIFSGIRRRLKHRTIATYARRLSREAAGRSTLLSGVRAIATINLVIIAGLVALLLPHRVIDDGVERFSGPRRAAADEALTDARGSGCLHHPLAAVLASALSVKEVRKVPNDPGLFSDPPISLRQRESPLAGYEVAVRVHTLFGIPARTITVREFEAVCS